MSAFNSEEFAKKLAEKALDEFLYKGKSIREWMKIIGSEDCISRKEVLKIFGDDIHPLDYRTNGFVNAIEALPPIINNECKAYILWEDVLKIINDVNNSYIFKQFTDENDEKYMSSELLIKELEEKVLKEDNK